jgi:hypothetical protein
MPLGLSKVLLRWYSHQRLSLRGFTGCICSIVTCTCAVILFVYATCITIVILILAYNDLKCICVLSFIVLPVYRMLLNLHVSLEILK